MERALLVIRNTKFAKSRLVPFGPRMAETLREYLKPRDQYWGVRNHMLCCCSCIMYSAAPGSCGRCSSDQPRLLPSSSA
jgi:site-specific recombinase XerD